MADDEGIESDRNFGNVPLRYEATRYYNIPTPRATQTRPSYRTGFMAALESQDAPPLFQRPVKVEFVLQELPLETTFARRLIEFDSTVTDALEMYYKRKFGSVPYILEKRVAFDSVNYGMFKGDASLMYIIPFGTIKVVS